MDVILIVTWADITPQNIGYSRSVYGRVLDEKAKGNKVVVLQIIYVSTDFENNIIEESIIDEVVFLRAVFKKPKLIGSIRNVFSFKTREEYIYGNELVQNKVGEIVEIYRPKTLQVESLWVLPATVNITGINKKLVVHDVIRNFYLSDLISNPSFKQKLNSMTKFIKVVFRERSIIERANINEYVFLTKEDEVWYKNHLNKNITSTVASNRLDVEPIKRVIDKDKPFILYPGSIEFSQNFLAMKWFFMKVIPLVEWDVTILITGTASKENRDKLSRVNSGCNVIFTGEIDKKELDNLNSKCIAVISPIISGTGIKIKVLEAVQRGIPVISTRKSAKGICSDLSYCSLDDSPDEYAKVFNSFIEKNAINLFKRKAI